MIDNNQFRLELIIQSEKEVINSVVQDYFNRKLQRAFYNYKAVKGFMGFLLTKLFTYVYVYELMHFEFGLVETMFVTPH